MDYRNAFDVTAASGHAVAAPISVGELAPSHCVPLARLMGLPPDAGDDALRVRDNTS
jgi:hypothetical protein